MSAIGSQLSSVFESSLPEWVERNFVMNAVSASILQEEERILSEHISAVDFLNEDSAKLFKFDDYSIEDKSDFFKDKERTLFRRSARGVYFEMSRLFENEDQLLSSDSSLDSDTTLWSGDNLKFYDSTYILSGWIANWTSPSRIDITPLNLPEQYSFMFTSADFVLVHAINNSDFTDEKAVSFIREYLLPFTVLSYFNFQKKLQYLVSLSVNDYRLGSVSGAGSYAEGSTAIIQAIPFTDVNFISWSDGVFALSRQLLITGDLTLQAEFAPILQVYTFESTKISTGNYTLTATFPDNVAERGFLIKYGSSTPSIDDYDEIYLGTGPSISKNVTVTQSSSAIAFIRFGEDVEYSETEELVASPIPDEYQLVEYLESTGIQYINTGYIPNINDNILFDVSFVQNLTVQMMGCMVESEGLYLRTHIGNYQNLLSIWIDTGGSNRIGKGYDNGRHIYEFTQTLCKFDNLTDINSNIYPNLQVFLFARNYNGVSNLCFARVYHFSAGNSRDMYSVYRKSDNKPGMYDVINNIFYTNQGSGEFIVGPDKEW